MLYELRFIEALHGLLLSPFADRLAVAVSFLGNGGMVWILAIVVLLLSPKTRKAGIVAAVALVAEAVICACLKIVIARPRPFDIDRSIELLIAPPSDYSFPSGHTASSFACASAIKDAGLRYSVPAFIRHFKAQPNILPRNSKKNSQLFSPNPSKITSLKQ